MTDSDTEWFQPGQRELPYADEVVEQNANPWGWLRTASGKTESENRLLKLARRSMLSLWSIPGPFTNEGLAASGSGKELCDLVVIFGDDVLLFSDKDCAFPKNKDINVAWSRWYRRAIVKSMKQLHGAEGALQRRSVQLFADAACTTPVPLPLPTSSRMRVHLIAVAHGARDSAERYWESLGGERGSTGSLMLNTELSGTAHEEHPFQFGWPLGKERYVHVLDGVTLSLLMQELDTVADFCDYLTRKEALFQKSGCDFVIPGEEELLAEYLHATAVKRTWSFPDFQPNSLVVLREGMWNRFIESRSYKAHKDASALSFLWDDLIEYQASHVIHGSTQEIFVGNEQNRGDGNERLLRVMASEKRFDRRALGETLRQGKSVASQRARFLRTMITQEKTRLYCFVFLPFLSDQQSHSEYRNYRQYLLHLYCEGALLRFPMAREIVGIAAAPYDSEIMSVDFMLMNVHDCRISSKDRQSLEEDLQKESIWTKDVVMYPVAEHQRFRKSNLLDFFRGRRRGTR